MKLDPARYVVARTYGGLGRLEHLDGVPCDVAPIPRRRHRCWPQTRMTGRGEMDLFCPCGGQKSAERWNWVFRNTRRPRTLEEEAQAERDRKADALIEAFYEAEVARDGQRMEQIRAQVKALIDDDAR